MKRILTATVLIVSIVCSAAGQNLRTSFTTAADLVEMCKDLDPNRAMREPALALAFGFCSGYFNGLVASNTLIDQLKGSGAALFCPPVGVTPGQARKVFLKYMTDHPE